MKDDPKNRLGEEILHYAKIAHLARQPICAIDRAGQLAYLMHQTIPSPCCCLYYLDKKHRLLAREVLYSGILLTAEECCAYLSRGMHTHRASSVFVSVAGGDEGMDRDDLDRASRIALFCESENIPLLDVIWVDRTDYLPVCRFFRNENI